jgi:putative heme degradation protein
VTQTQIVLEPRQKPEELLAAQFADKSPAEQKELLARLERSGAAVYRALAKAESDAAARDELLAAAEREEQNAQVLEDMA